MAYPAIGLAVMLGFAIGAAIYIIFTNNERHQYGYQQTTNGRVVNELHVVLPRPRNARRSNKRTCDICRDVVSNNEEELECGHVYHRLCLETRFKELYGSRSCRNNSSLHSNGDHPRQCIMCYRSNNTEKCCICQEYLLSDLSTLSCNHVFHKNCITRWLRISRTCPYRCHIRET